MFKKLWGLTWYKQKETPTKDSTPYRIWLDGVEIPPETPLTRDDSFRELNALALDRALYGKCITRDGKRVPPEEWDDIRLTDDEWK